MLFVAPQGAVTKVHGLIGWDNKGTLQHMAKMSYMTERADRLEGLGVRLVDKAPLENGLACGFIFVFRVALQICSVIVHFYFSCSTDFGSVSAESLIPSLTSGEFFVCSKNDNKSNSPDIIAVARSPLCGPFPPAMGTSGPI